MDVEKTEGANAEIYENLEKYLFTVVEVNSSVAPQERKYHYKYI